MKSTSKFIALLLLFAAIGIVPAEAKARFQEVLRR